MADLNHEIAVVYQPPFEFDLKLKNLLFTFNSEAKNRSAVVFLIKVPSMSKLTILYLMLIV